ncbi:MAG: class II glutamine amidotransferase [Polyangiales bacterium]
MCRLFGFRSVIQSQVHRSLMDADNALGAQSADHPDGWGVAYYVDGAPHITRSPTTAIDCALFRRVSGIVASETVLAHVRRATTGENSVLNCHPFQYGKWIMAHNGDIQDFPKHRAELVQRVAPVLRRYILGETDSEVVFFLFLTHLSRHGPLSGRIGVEETTMALQSTLEQVRAICDLDPAKEASLLTTIVTDGTTMVAAEGGKELFWSTYKTRCGDRDTCPSLSPECEAPSESGYVNHLIFSSEVIRGENIWLPLESGELIGVDWRMKLLRTSGHRHLAVVN